MTLDTKSEQLLTAASDILTECETQLRGARNNKEADRVRSAHYLIYLVLKPDTQLIREPTIPAGQVSKLKPPARSKKKRK